MLELNKIHLGDCLDLLKQIDDHSIDLLLTDPPYGMNFLSGQRKKKVHGRIQNDDGLDWLEPFLVECERVLKEDAHAYIFCSHHHLDMFMSTVKKYLPYKNLLVWDKQTHGMGDLFGDYAPAHELIIFCSNGKKKLNGKRHKNILQFDRTGNKLHPTEKPVDLFKLLIEKSTKENDLVLDPFAGSATAGVACINSDRNFLCIENDKKHHVVGMERLRISS